MHLALSIDLDRLALTVIVPAVSAETVSAYSYLPWEESYFSRYASMDSFVGVVDSDDFIALSVEHLTECETIK